MSALRQLYILLMTTAFPFLLLVSACGQEPVQEPVPPAETAPVAALPAERIKEVKAALEEIKMALANEGEYLCCVEPACDWCLLHEGECKCRENLDAKKEVCAGCGLGWHNGEGVVEGVKASDVKWNIVHAHEEEGESHAH